MVKSVFVDPSHIEGLEKSGANYLIVAGENITADNWQIVKNLGMDLGIAVNAFKKNVCPADPVTQQELFNKIDRVLQFEPKEIWLDYFRFGGDCTDVTDGNVAKAHLECQYCQGKDRVELLINLANQIVKHVNNKSKVGIFTVALKNSEAPKLAQALGLDYAQLGKIFDQFCPMLYHRMIDKPVSYISEYVKYLSDLTGKPVLSIIQIKDMPDDLEDKMSEEDIMAAFNEAIKEPSIGVCFFWWEHALEKGKTEIISRLFVNAV